MNVAAGNPVPKEIYVLDTETTGLDGAPVDVVVDIGITRVELARGLVEEAYHSTLGYDVDGWNDRRRNAWIFQNTDLRLDEVAVSTPASEVIGDVRHLLKGKAVTAYNIAYDMEKFLYHEPWNLKGEFEICTDIMLAAMPVCRIPSVYYGRKYSFPKLEVAYERILGGEDPAGIRGKQSHRALSDAFMASYVMVKLYEDGLYLP